MIPVANPMTMIPVRVTISHDDDPMSPMEGDGTWTVYSFNRRHVDYKDPESIGLALELDDDGLPVVRNPGLRRKLETGLAFFLSYYEHGACKWSLIDEGPSCRFDTARIAGILIWTHKPKEMGARTRADRAKDARLFLESYTAWCNGEVYGYGVDDPEGDIEDSCWGFYGNDTEYMLETIRAACGDRPVIFNGDAAWVGDRYKGVTFDPKIHEAPASDD